MLQHTTLKAIMLQIGKWEAYESICKVRAVKYDSEEIVGCRNWDRLLGRQPAIWPMAEVWTMAQNTSSEAGKLVHAAVRDNRGVHRGLPNTLCEIALNQPPAGINSQRIVSGLVDAKTWHGASYVCRACMEYLPASQLVQVFKAFKDRDPYVRRCSAGGYEYRERGSQHYLRLNLRDD